MFNEQGNDTRKRYVQIMEGSDIRLKYCANIGRSVVILLVNVLKSCGDLHETGLRHICADFISRMTFYTRIFERL